MFIASDLNRLGYVHGGKAYYQIRVCSWYVQRAPKPGTMYSTCCATNDIVIIVSII